MTNNNQQVSAQETCQNVLMPDGVGVLNQVVQRNVLEKVMFKLGRKGKESAIEKFRGMCFSSTESSWCRGRKKMMAQMAGTEQSAERPCVVSSEKWARTWSREVLLSTACLS